MKINTFPKITHLYAFKKKGLILSLQWTLQYLTFQTMKVIYFRSHEITESYLITKLSLHRVSHEWTHFNPSVFNLGMGRATNSKENKITSNYDHLPLLQWCSIQFFYTLIWLSAARHMEFLYKYSFLRCADFWYGFPKNMDFIGNFYY